jgi:hypothetical protein
MPPVVKKPCVNNSQFSFSGKELSPLGNGYSADAEQVGTIMEGRDKSMWMIGIKNGVKVWNRVPTDLSKDASILADLTPPDMKKKEDDVPVKKKAPAKKKETKKSVTVVSESEAEPDAESDASPQEKKTAEKKSEKKKSDTETENEEEEKEEAPKKKKAVKKKDDDKKDDKKDKPKRQPTDFNNFMSYQIKIIGEENPGMSHKEKFAKVASLWKSMDEDARKAVLEKAK